MISGSVNGAGHWNGRGAQWPRRSLSHGPFPRVPKSSWSSRVRGVLCEDGRRNNVVPRCCRTSAHTQYAIHGYMAAPMKDPNRY